MTTHIHIHVGRTKDAGFDESKVKRGDGGKFSTTTGGTTVQQHSAAAEKHGKESEENKHSMEPSAWNSHNAAPAHEIAARYLGLAQRADKMGNAKRAEEAHGIASHYAKVALQHETGHGGQVDPPPKKLSTKTLMEHLGGRHASATFGAGSGIISGISKTQNIPGAIAALEAKGSQVSAVKGSGGTTELWYLKPGEKWGAHMQQTKAETLARFGIKHNGD